MPDLSWDDFSQQLGVAAKPATNTAPLTAQALKVTTSEAVQRVPQSRFADPDIATKLGARPGVPFDTVHGLDFSERFVFETLPTDQDKEAWLKQKYPGAYRTNNYGHFIVTKTQDGKPTDVMVNPMGIDWEDLSTVASALPELVGAALPIILTRGATLAPGLWRALGTLGLSALGAEAAGGVKDIVSRWAIGQDTDIEEIAKRRTVSGAKGIAIGAGFGLAGKVYGIVRSPFSNVGKVQLDAVAAQKYFKDKFGIEIPMTAAESTGSPLLQRGEAMEMAKPGASTAFGKFKTKQLGAVDELRKIATGVVSDEEEVGKKVISAVGGKVAPLEFEVERTAAAAADEASKAIKQGIGTRVDKTVVGKAIESGAKAERAKFQADSTKLYDDVFSNPLTQQKNISGTPLANDATNLLAKAPSVERTVTQLTGLVNPQGKPVTMTLTRKEPLKEFVPANVLPKLDALRKGRDQFFRLDELMAMRREVDNDIALGESIPGVQTRYLSKIRDMLTNRITDGLKQMDPALLVKWQKANEFYANGVGRFKRAGISEIFRDPEQGGYLGPTELVSRVTSGSAKSQDVYTAYKEFFGPNSPQIQGIQQSVRDDVLGQSQLGDTLDAKGFIARLQDLDKNAPELLRDVFGAAAPQLRKEATILATAQGTTVPKEELISAINSGSLSARKLTEMIAAQAKRDDAYRNELVRDIAKGAVSPEKIKPTEVVDKFVFRKTTQPEQLDELMKQLASRPDVTEDLKRLTFKKVLDNATVRLKSGESTLSSQAIDDLLRNENTAKRLETVLGPDSMEDLRQLSAFLKPGETMIESARSAGGIAAGQQIAGIWERGELKYINRAVKNLVLATIYLNPVFKKALTNTSLGAEEKALLVNTMIASAPFARALLGTFTKEGAKDAMFELKQGVDSIITQNQPREAQSPSDIPWDEFLNKLESP